MMKIERIEIMLIACEYEERGEKTGRKKRFETQEKTFSHLLLQSMSQADERGNYKRNINWKTPPTHPLHSLLLSLVQVCQHRTSMTMYRTTFRAMFSSSSCLNSLPCSSSITSLDGLSPFMKGGGERRTRFLKSLFLVHERESFEGRVKKREGGVFSSIAIRGLTHLLLFQG